MSRDKQRRKKRKKKQKQVQDAAKEDIRKRNSRPKPQGLEKLLRTLAKHPKTINLANLPILALPHTWNPFEDKRLFIYFTVSIAIATILINMWAHLKTLDDFDLDEVFDIDDNYH